MEVTELKKALKLNTKTSSLVLNETYHNVKKCQCEDTQTVELKERVLTFLKTLAEKSLRIQLKKTKNITGALEFQILSEKPDLRILMSKWARRRGLTFETFLKNLFNQKLVEHELLGYFYRNHISKFEFQPYDLIYFRPCKVPVLIECKASGVDRLKSGEVKLSANARRYENHAKQLHKIEDFLKKAGSKLYFAFLNDVLGEIFFVSHEIISKNIDTLFKRRTILNENEYCSLKIKDQINKDELELVLEFLNA